MKKTHISINHFSALLAKKRKSLFNLNFINLIKNNLHLCDVKHFIFEAKDSQVIYFFLCCQILFYKNLF